MSQPGPGSAAETDTGAGAEVDTAIEEILPLSPLAQGLLYHALYDENERDVYTLQAVMELEGELDGARLAAAADAVLARHANLRAAFLHEDLDEPVQAVLTDVTARLTRVDLSDLDEAERERRVDELLAADEAARFDLADPPLLRLIAIRTGQGAHLLVVTTHHLLLDGWSLPLLVRDLLELYAVGDDAADPGALAPVRPYRDFLVWLAEQDRDAATQTWQQALDGVEAPTLLAPAGTSRVPAAPEIVTLRLTEELTARLHRTAASLRITVNTMVQALWGLLLGRLTDRDDVVFGATVSGRPAELPGMEFMVGLFINTVPCRVRARAAEPVRELLHRLQGEQAALLDVHHLALGDIQRSVGLGDLFDTLLVFENYPLDSSAVVDAAARGGLRLGEVSAGGATHYPLTLAVFDADRLSIDFEARPDLFDRAAVATIAERFQRLLEQVLADTERPVASLDILSTGERSALLERGRRPAVAGAATLVEAFEDQVERSPEATAVVGQDEALSFAELNARANRLARLLVERGAGPERVVVLALPPTPELVVAILAVLKAGAAYLPVDPAWPAERIGLMLADARPVAVLGTGAVTDHPDVAAHPGTVALDAPELSAALGAAAEHNLDAAPRPDHPAYVIYTSGSTGMPKAVVVPHRAIANLLAAHRDAILDPAWRDVGRPLRVGHAWPTAFDASWQPMLWMFAGHELHLVPEDTRRDPALLRGFLAERGIEFIELSPTLLAEVAGEPGWRAGLRVIAVGGEAVAPSLWRALRDEPGLRAVNLYGPTECTVDSAWCAVSASADPAIGVPVAGASLRVLDRRLRPVPLGVTGELYIAGAGLARGYLDRPGATAARFVADPYAERPGSLMYRTGDLARWNADGVVECLGRGDDQVKIRGFRVEPGEIEAVLAGHEQVDRAAVVVRESGTGLRRLVAYVTAREGATVVPARVREHVASVLPEHMVPAAVVALDAFPLTRNGKLDVAALPEPDASSDGGQHEPPRTETERVLAAAFAEVLGVDSVGVHDSFFALGGDSIVSMRLVSRARAAGLSLSPRDVFERRTVAGLAAHAESTGSDAGERPGAVSGVGEVPLTPILHWLVDQGAPFERLCQGRVVVAPSDLDVERLVALVGTVLDRHDALRATFRRSGAGEDGDGWSFTTHPAGSVDAAGCVRRVDVGGMDGGQLDELLPRLFADTAAELDPASGVLARFVWCDAGRDVSGRLLIVVHHLVVDAASWQTVLADLAEAWPAVRRGERYRSRPAGTPVREWAIGLREEARRRGAELDLWSGMLGAPDPVLGRRRLDPAADTRATVRTLQVALDPRRTEPLLTTLPAQHGVAVQDVLLTAFARSVARLRGTGDTAVLIALEGHGREEQLVPHAQLSEAVGWFTSVFPVRVDPGDPRDTGAGKALRRVAEQLAELPDKGVGYGLLRYLNPDTAAELARFDGPQLEFNYLGTVTLGGRAAVAQDWSLDPGAGALADADPRAPAPYSLVVDAAMVDDGDGTALRATLQWPAGVLDAPDIDLLVEYWFSELDDLAAGDTR